MDPGLPTYQELLEVTGPPPPRRPVGSVRDAEARHVALWPLRCPRHGAPVADFQLPVRPPLDHVVHAGDRAVEVLWVCGCTASLPLCPWGCAGCRAKVVRWADALDP